jgi:DNA-binding PadR family transcriptional regulator
MLELAILGLLKEKEMHGYELKKRLTETLGMVSGVSFGSLYPALRRLEAAGAVTTVEAGDSAPPVPFTGSLGGELAAFKARKMVTRNSRGKKVYGITQRGEALFAELLETESQSSDDDRTFNLRLAFARHLPADARLGMLERRRSFLLERRLQLRTRVPTVRDTYLRSLVEHDHESAERDLTWIDRLIAGERAGHHTSPARPDQTGGATALRIPGGRPGTNEEDTDT